MGRLENKIAVITGAASGIGSATAQRFVEEGATIAALDLVTPEGEAWDSICATAPESDSFIVDVTKEPSIEEAVRAVITKYGRIDVLVNGAGVSSGGATEDITEEEWDRVMDINLKGSFFVAKHVVRQMIKQSSGSIVHIASIEGLDGLSGQLAYGTSKGAVVQMTRNMAADYATMGIRVNCVCPGAIETPMTAILNDESLKEIKTQMENAHLMERFGLPHEVANGILYLASDEASFVTGHPLVIDGGWVAGTRLKY